MQQQKGLPEGYGFRVVSDADEEGTIVEVSLVASRWKPGSWLDSMFSRYVLTICHEFESPNVEDTVLSQKVEELKQDLLQKYYSSAI